MDRTQALSTLNGKILAAYSRRTMTALRAGLPLRLVLPRLEPVFALNVDKEVRKDGLVIRRAADALTAGTPPGREAVRQLVEATKAIDREFLDRVQAFPVRISIRYDDIAPVRARRIERLLGAAYRILVAWNAESRLRPALRASFPESEFERLLHELLELYALETRALSRSVGLPALLAPVREHLAQSLFAIMDNVARCLAAELARAVYHRVPDMPGSTTKSVL
jgi:hypothetical protein